MKKRITKVEALVNELMSIDSLKPTAIIVEEELAELARNNNQEIIKPTELIYDIVATARAFNKKIIVVLNEKEFSLLDESIVANLEVLRA